MRLGRIAVWVVVALGLFSVEAGVVCLTTEAALHQQQATAAYKRGDLAEATAELRQAIRLCPSEPFYSFMLGNALYRADKRLEAEAAYRLATEQDPSFIEARMSFGFTLFELERPKEALEQWLSAMRMQTDSAFARAALAVGLYASGDQDNAVIQYDQAVRLEARYADDKAVALDIRWKPPAMGILNKLKELSKKQGQENRDGS